MQTRINSKSFQDTETRSGTFSLSGAFDNIAVVAETLGSSWDGSFILAAYFHQIWLYYTIWAVGRDDAKTCKIMWRNLGDIRAVASQRMPHTILSSVKAELLL